MRQLVETYQFDNFTSALVLSSLDEAVSGCDFIVADPDVADLLPAPANMLLAGGERHKTLGELEQLIGAFVRQRLSRNSTVLAFGGGLLCDLAGFAAAVYMRGCGLILVPTTLLAMVDAGLGGKTACNYQNYKNMVGTFYPAGEVRIVPEVLASLPPRQFQSGLAELCKHALLSESPQLWHKLQKAGGQLRAPILEASPSERALQLSELLIEAVRVKGQIVQRDLYERGERAFLNLGHTYAHALETVTTFACTHGEAVAWGINQALQLSAHLGYCQDDYAQEVRKLLLKLGFELNLARLCPDFFSAQAGCDETSARQKLTSDLLAAMHFDKKRSQDGIRLVLQRGRGQTLIEALSAEQIQPCLVQNL